MNTPTKNEARAAEVPESAREPGTLQGLPTELAGRKNAEDTVCPKPPIILCVYESCRMHFPGVGLHKPE